MILSIALKEFYNNLVSARFVIGFLLCLVLVPLTLIVGIDDFKGKLDTYEVQKESAEKALEIKVYSALRPIVVKEPEPLGIFSRGISYNVGSKVKIQLGTRPFVAEGRAAVSENPLMNSFFSLDFCTILALVLSLLALLFTYDACSGEREQGTLKLVVSNSIRRSTVLLGKVLGACLTLLPIILFCYIISVLVITFSSHVSFTASEWTRVGMLFLASILFFALFVFLGLFISSRFRSSAASIIVCLFAWSFFLFIVPNLSGYLACSLVEMPSRENLNFAMGDLNNEYWKKVREYEKTLGEPEWRSTWYYSGGGDGYRQLFGTSRSRYEYYRQIHIYSQPLLIDYADKKWVLQKAYKDQMNRQRQFAERLSMVSPSQVFRLLCSALCRTDVAAHERFLENAARYREVFIQYFEDLKIFASFKYFTPIPPERFMTADEIVRYWTEGQMQSQQEYNEWVAANPTKWASSNIITKKINDWEPDNYGLLDVSDIPDYTWEKPSTGMALKNSLAKIAVLLFAGVLLFYLSFISFIKYDVR